MRQHDRLDAQRTQHAQGLAHLAGILADIHGAPVQGQGLIVSRLAGAGGGDRVVSRSGEAGAAHFTQRNVPLLRGG